MATIFYFTGTGNSLSIAKQLAEQLDAKLESIVSYMNGKRQIEDDLIGLVVPIHCMDIPRIAKIFLRDAKFPKKSYIFGVVTCGAIDGNALHHMTEILAEKGLELSYGTTIYLPDNSIVFPTDSEKKGQMLKDQPSRIETICANVKQRTVNAHTLDKTLKHRVMSKCLTIGLKSIYKIKSKTVSKSTCIQCGICEKICPSSAIQKENDTYKIANDCENCFACAHWCPTRAISLGKLTPNDKTHYTHPKVTVHDIMIQKKK
jgi:ferredoxin